jgi:hypothetical protein
VPTPSRGQPSRPLRLWIYNRSLQGRPGAPIAASTARWGATATAVRRGSIIQAW